jgi:hypothetical protein
MLSWLQFRRIRRQEDKKSRWTCSQHAEPQARMPPSTVQDQHALFRRTRADLTGEGSEFHFKEGDTDAGGQRGQMEDRVARGRMDKANEIAPGEAVAHWCERSLANRRPHATQERFQADTMLVHRPQLDAGGRVGSHHLSEQRP